MKDEMTFKCSSALSAAEISAAKDIVKMIKEVGLIVYSKA